MAAFTDTLVGTQTLVCSVGGDGINNNPAVRVPICQCYLAGVVKCVDNRCSVRGKNEPEDLHKAFGKLECSSARSNQVVPELCVRLCSLEYIFDGFMLLASVREVAVVDKRQDCYDDVEERSVVSIRVGVCCAVSNAFMNVD